MENTSRQLSTLVSYPSLIPYEESLEKNPYDVKGWAGYLTEIDDILDALGERFEELVVRGGTSGGGKKKKKSKSMARDEAMEVGGRTIRLDAGAGAGAGAGGGPVYILTGEIHALQSARNQVSERSLSLLPGSYRLWWDYLQFRSEVLTGSSSGGAAAAAAAGTAATPTPTNVWHHHRLISGTAPRCRHTNDVSSGATSIPAYGSRTLRT